MIGSVLSAGVQIIGDRTDSGTSSDDGGARFGVIVAVSALLASLVVAVASHVRQSDESEN